MGRLIPAEKGELIDPYALRRENAELKSLVQELEEALSRYENGYQGSCYACEPVGIFNQRLEVKVQKLVTRITDLEECLRQVYLAKGVTDKCRLHIDKVLEVK